MQTNVDDLSAAVKEFETALPDWWWSVGHCSLTRDASCGPDLNGDDAYLLKLPNNTVFDEGFHCDDPNGTLATSLRNVMQQGLEAKVKFAEVA